MVSILFFSSNQSELFPKEIKKNKRALAGAFVFLMEIINDFVYFKPEHFGHLVHMRGFGLANSLAPAVDGLGADMYFLCEPFEVFSLL